MALPINQISDSALAALASSKTPYLNLPVIQTDPMGEYLKGQTNSLFQKAQLQSVYDQMKNQYAIQQMNNQATMAQKLYQAKLDMIKQQQQQQFEAGQQTQRLGSQEGIAAMNTQMEQQKLNELAGYHQGQLGIQQGQLGISGQNLELEKAKAAQQADYQNQDLAIKSAHEQMLARQQLNIEDLHKRGAAAQVLQQDIATAQQQFPNDPDKQNMYINSRLSALRGLGIIDDNEVQKLSNASLNDKQALIHYDLQLSTAGKQLQEGQPQFTPAGYTPLSQTTRAKTEEAAQTGLDTISSLNSLKENNDPSFYNVGILKSTLGEAANAAHSALGTPQTDAGKLADDRAKYFASVRAAAGPLLQQLGAAKLSNRTIGLVSQMLPDGKEASVDEANAKIEGLTEAAKIFTGMRQDQLKNGIPINEASYQQQLQRVMDQYGISAMKNYDPRVIAAAKNAGMSVEQFAEQQAKAHDVTVGQVLKSWRVKND